MCDEYTVLRDGKWIGSGLLKDVNEEKLISLMVGRDIQEIYPPVNPHGDQVVLQVEVKERQVVVHLVLIGITVHFAHAKGAVIDAVAVRNNNRKGLNFHNMFSFRFMPCMFTIRSSIF